MCAYRQCITNCALIGPDSNWNTVVYLGTSCPGQWMIVNGKGQVSTCGLPQPHGVEGIQGCWKHVVGLWKLK